MDPSLIQVLLTGHKWTEIKIPPPHSNPQYQIQSIRVRDVDGLYEFREMPRLVSEEVATSLLWNSRK